MQGQKLAVGGDPNKKYIVADALEVLENYQDEANLIYLDDAWARPQRGGQFGVTYPTHEFDRADQGNSGITTIDLIDACYDALTDGGWLISDADDWLLPRMVNYLQKKWGDVAGTYEGGGYRKVGGVTYLTKNGSDNDEPLPDRSTAGMYLSNGGYPVVFAHKGETDKRTSTSARQVTTRQNENYGWGSVKPTEPYIRWVDALLNPDELLLVPCAGTAPAAIAAEKLYSDEAKYVCIDIEEEAWHAFSRRRKDEVLSTTGIEDFETR